MNEDKVNIDLTGGDLNIKVTTEPNLVILNVIAWILNLAVLLMFLLVILK